LLTSIETGPRLLEVGDDRADVGLELHVELGSSAPHARGAKRSRRRSCACSAVVVAGLTTMAPRLPSARRDRLADPRDALVTSARWPWEIHHAPFESLHG
jgi:hypothetical protein